MCTKSISGLSVVVIDDDPDILFLITSILKSHFKEIKTFYDAEEALSYLKGLENAIVLVDYFMKPMKGEEVVKKIKKQNPNIGVILITGIASDREILSLYKLGIDDYIRKPFSGDELLIRVCGVLERMKLKRELRDVRKRLSGKFASLGLIGTSRAFKKLLGEIERYAQVDVPVLIFGETGTGKELVANAIHTLSKRKNKPFVPINCAFFNTELLESELFGYEKGAFTGAVKSFGGIIGEAKGGTLFLDEIAEMSLQVQSKLLRFLQFGTYRPLGSGKELKADVRIIGATNKNLTKMVEDGSFREDLYYRIAVGVIHVPPLRERKEDIPLLIEYVKNKLLTNIIPDVESVIFEKEAIEFLQDYHWPGNIRELENLITRILVENRGNVVTREFVESKLGMDREVENERKVLRGNPKVSLRQLREEFYENLERDYIEGLLERTKGNVSAAARLAGVSRKTFWNLLKKYNLDPSRYRGS